MYLCVCVGVRSELRAGDFAPDHSGNLSAQVQINMLSSWPIALAKFRPPCCDIWQTMGPAWSPPNKKKNCRRYENDSKSRNGNEALDDNVLVDAFCFEAYSVFGFVFLKNLGISSGTFGHTKERDEQSEEPIELIIAKSKGCSIIVRRKR